MKIVVNPQYSFLRKHIERLPETFDMGEVIYNARNILRRFSWEGVSVIVKKYKVPIFINRAIYGRLRKSKAHRSYEYASRLLSMNIRTPHPIAYIEEYKYGLLTDSYLATTEETFTHMMREFHLDTSLTDENKEVLQAFAAFTEKIHKCGVLHHDYSPGNIAFEHTENGIEFSLFDINRMDFGTISKRKCLANFCRLTPSTKILTYIGEKYATLRGWDTKHSIEYMLKKQSAFFNRANKRNAKKAKRRNK